VPQQLPLPYAADPRRRTSPPDPDRKNAATANCRIASKLAMCIALLPARRQSGNTGKMAEMKTVAVEAGKGGSGKTTTTLNLAVAASIAGKTVVVIDLDPQASAAGWKDSRAAETPVVVSVPPARLPQALQTAREGGAELVLIDTAPHSESAALAAAKAADVILIPTRPGILDLRAIGATADLAKIAGKQAFVVLNAIPPGATRLVEDAKAAAAVHGLDVAPVVIEQRAALSHSLTAGQTAQEYEPKGKAAEEISRLYKWLEKRLA
jgi:chromosome partitioning protein